MLYYQDRCRACGDCLAACPEHAIVRADSHVALTDACVKCGTCVDTCASDARQIAGKRMRASEVMAAIERDLIFFDDSGGGVTFSGGEPLSQPKLLDALLTACRERRIHTTLETCGMAARDLVLRICEKADLILYDLKLVNPTKHKKYTGVSNRLILHNLQALVGAGRPVITRIPIVPGINDSDEDVREFREFLAPLRVRRIDLLPYHRAGTEKYSRMGLSYQLADVEPPSILHIEQIANELGKTGIPVKIGG